MNVLDSIPFDIFQTIIEELSLPALVSFASTRKSHAPVPAKAMYARIAQLEEAEEAAATEALRSDVAHVAHLAKEAEEYAEEEAKWFPNGEGNIEDGEPGSDWSEEAF